MAQDGAMQKFLDFLTELERFNIHYRLEANRLAGPGSEAVMVLIAVPGERWEVEFFPDGHVEVETFISKPMEGEEALVRLFAVHCE